MKRDDKYWMRCCLKLAQHGAGSVSPNPMVGAIIVRNGKKISEGYHKNYGGAHAEVNAINFAVRKRIDLAGSTMYINLEPCSHYGKTPPCVDLILKHGFSRVVIASEDPNPLVSGKSVLKLKNNGVRCTVGTLKSDAARLNEYFFKYITEKIPYIALKAAQTSNGFIASDGTGVKWITNIQSRSLGHDLRKNYDAILVGANTVMNDDPRLTVRHVKGKNPIRVVVDGKFSVAPSRKIFTSTAHTLLYVSTESVQKNHKKARVLRNNGVEIISLKGNRGRLNINQIVHDLGKRKIISVLIEGGQQTYTSFLNAKAVDKMYMFTAKRQFLKGLKTFEGITVSYRLKQISTRQLGSDYFQESDIIYS